VDLSQGIVEHAPVVVRIPLLNEAECQRNWQAAKALRKYWTHRHAFLPSYSVGAAAYLDVPAEGVHTYLMRAIRMNKFLRRDFGPLAESVRAAIEDHVGATTVISPRFAVPGFHIFETHPRLDELKPRVHFDLQGLRLDFKSEDAEDPEKRLSFTIAVSLPKGGAGLNTWDFQHSEYMQMTPAEVEDYFATLQATYHSYNLGELVIHTGSKLHAIAANLEMDPDDARVTYQGHAQFTQGQWQLYW
jgi:hypothetical protein